MRKEKKETTLLVPGGKCFCLVTAALGSKEKKDGWNRSAKVQNKYQIHNDYDHCQELYSVMVTGRKDLLWSLFNLNLLSYVWSHFFFASVVDPDALLAASDWRPLPVVGASCTLECLVPCPLLLSALSLLGNHLQHPNDLWLSRTDGHQAGDRGLITGLNLVYINYILRTIFTINWQLIYIDIQGKEVLLSHTSTSLSGVLWVSGVRWPPVPQVAPCPAPPVSSPPPGVPGAGRRAVAPADLVPG